MAYCRGYECGILQGLRIHSGGQSSSGARRCRLARRDRRKSDGGHLRQIIRDLKPTVAPSKIQFDATEAIRFAADRAILVGLIINELVSNAGKYAYLNRAGGSIWVRVETENESVAISVRDEGVGLPPSFDPTASKRLGTRLVTALLKQLGGELTRLPTPIGVNFTLHIPLRAAATR